MRRLLVAVFAMVALVGMMAAPVAAQSEDLAMNESVIKTLGYPEIEVNVLEDGIQAPSTLTEGYYLVSLSTFGDNVAYLDIVQPPAGLSEEEATQLMYDAGANDLAQPDWVYAGGTNTFAPGDISSFIVYLAAGEYKYGASYYAMAQGAEEVMRLAPLTVTAATPSAGDASASPVPTDEPAAAVTIEETDDLRYIVSPDPVPAGPQIYKITNTGMHHAHHMVMVGIPEEVTAEQIIGAFSGMMSGTPSAGPSIFEQFTYTAYAALQSGGQTTWTQFDLKPGKYALICFIIDPETGAPHVVNGMATTFTVA